MYGTDVRTAASSKRDPRGLGPHHHGASSERPLAHVSAPGSDAHSAMATPTQRLARYGHHTHRAPEWGSSPHVYRPRRPTTTPLYPVVQHHLETFLAQATESDPMGYGVPSWVEKDLRAYLRCGILAHGFAGLRCEDCGQERLLAYSCASRGVCPSCNTRRMAEVADHVADHVTDHVLPHLPVRQWVLSLPNHPRRGRALALASRLSGRRGDRRGRGDNEPGLPLCGKARCRVGLDPRGALALGAGFESQLSPILWVYSRSTDPQRILIACLIP